VAALAAAGLLLTAQLAAAQVAPGVSSPVKGWTLAGSTEVATVSDESGVAVGAAVAWNFTPRWAIEIGGQWLDRPAGEEAWAVLATTQFRLLPEGRYVPYVRAGLAAYTTTLDSAMPAVPGFYARRMQRLQSQSWFRNRHTFTDPAIVLGGGLDLQITGNLYLRPTVDVLAVIRSGDSLVTPIAGLQVAYHFATGRVTPARVR
jgi:hypothetical protein